MTLDEAASDQIFGGSEWRERHYNARNPEDPSHTAKAYVWFKQGPLTASLTSQRENGWVGWRVDVYFKTTMILLPFPGFWSLNSERVCVDRSGAAA